MVRSLFRAKYWKGCNKTSGNLEKPKRENNMESK